MVFFIYLIVAVSGASVLVIEILGTRVLGPFYGVDIFLWSALISVTLAALAAGYFVGGKAADKRKKDSDLAFILMISAILIAIIPAEKNLIIGLTQSISLRFAVLSSAFVLFFPPLFLLGMVSPIAIKLKTKELGEIGRSAGNLFAISTLSSVIAALATGFILIPYFGILEILLADASVLGIMGIIFLIKIKKWRSALAAGSASILLLILLFLLMKKVPLEEKNIIFSKNSFYGKVEVLEKEGLRYLLIDKSIHTIEDIENYESMMDYAIVMDIFKYSFPQPGQLLIIGLGGGSLAKSYYLAGWDVEAIEINPVVVDVAKKFFKISDQIAKIHIEDGRRFLTSTNKKYDLIILDAFGSSSIPFHLITQESFRLIKRHLTPDGYLALNIESIGWESDVSLSIHRTLKTVFEHVTIFPLDEPPNVLGNLILIAGSHEIMIDEAVLGNPVEWVDVDAVEHWKVLERNHAWDNRFHANVQKGIILTDNRNPIDIWSQEINAHYRRELKQYFSN